MVQHHALTIALAVVQVPPPAGAKDGQKLLHLQQPVHQPGDGQVARSDVVVQILRERLDDEIRGVALAGDRGGEVPRALGELAPRVERREPNVEMTLTFHQTGEGALVGIAERDDSTTFDGAHLHLHEET